MSKFGTPLGELLKKNQFKKFELVNLGASGSGKSTRSLTATQFGPVYIRDFDGKIQGCIRNIPDKLKSQVDLSKIHIEDCRGWDYTKLLNHTIEMKKAADAGQFPFATVVEDTFTNMSEIVYQSIFPNEEKLFVSNVLQLWGKVGHRTSNLFSVLQSLPCNIIVNCHTKEDEAGRPIGPMGKGGFRDHLKARVTDMHYLVFEGGKNLVRVKNSNLPPVNTNIDPKWVDPKGYSTEFGLKVFEDYAYKLEAK